MSEDTWTEADGGLLQVILASDWLRTLILTSDWLMLQLFDTDSLGNPGSVAASLVPRPNSFALFEVSPVSFHAVSEVLSETKTRQALALLDRGQEIKWILSKQLQYTTGEQHLCSFTVQVVCDENFEQQFKDFLNH